MKQLVDSWLQAYLQAWRSNDPDDIRILFTPGASYAGGPLDPDAWHGVDEIVAGWLQTQDEPGSWSFEGAPIAYDDGVGIVEGRTEYSDGKVYANLWVITFAEDGRASSFVEWFMVPGPVRGEPGQTASGQRQPT